MTRYFLVFWCFFLSLCSLSSSAQRHIEVRMDGIFSFDPITGWYVEQSLEPVATYIEAWREEDADITLAIKDSLSWGYRHYLSVVDTTLLDRVVDYLDAKLIPQSDTTYIKYRDLSGFSQSREFKEFFNSDIEAIKRYYSTPLICFDTILYYDPYGNNEFESLFHTFQCDVSGAELSLFSPPRLEASVPRECFVRNVTSLLYYDNSLVVVEMSGEEIREYMEKSYARRFYRVRESSDDLLKHRVPAYLFVSLSKVEHTLNLTKPVDKRIENWELDDAKIYRVAVNSFLAGDMTVVKECGDYKTLMIEWLRTTDNPFRVKTNIEIQPRRITDSIKMRERKSIFGKQI